MRDTACRLEGFAHNSSLLGEPGFAPKPFDGLTELLRRDILLRYIETSSEFFYPTANHGLFAHLRNDYERHSIGETFAYAVHAAVRNEYGRAL